MSETESPSQAFTGSVFDIRNFNEFSTALRSLSNDEETHRLTDGMGELSAAIEKVGQALSTKQPGATVGPMLVELLTTLRKHRLLVVGLSESWRNLYEYAAYLAALNNFRVLVGQWLVERNISGDNEVVIDDFEMIGWRTLGEGLLMIDIHEQSLSQAAPNTEIMSVDDPRVAKANNWWSRLRGSKNEG